MGYNSKACRLTDELMDDLNGRIFGEETFLPSEQRLAAHYHASRYTIRRIIENLTARGVLQRQSNHRVKINREQINERPPTAPTTIHIAWAYAAYPDTMIGQVSDGIKNYAEDHGLHLRLFCSTSDHEPVLNGIEHAATLQVNGIILMPYQTESYLNAIHRAMRDGVKVVTISDVAGGAASSICGDDYGGAFTAVRTLIERFNRPVFFLGPIDENASSRDRYRAYQQAMDDAGFGAEIAAGSLAIPAYGADPETWDIQDKWQRTTNLALEKLQGLKFPVSLFCVNDYFACGVYRACEQMGLQIGKDVFLIGFDDMPLAKRMTPPLTTIRVDSEQVGYQGARLLHQLIKGELSQSVNLKIPATLVERGSCGAQH